MMVQGGCGRLPPIDKADSFRGCGEWESQGAKLLGGLTLVPLVPAWEECDD